MRLTIHHSLTRRGDFDDGDVGPGDSDLDDIDLDVSRGTTVREIVAEFWAPRVWCGAVNLDQEHPAGEWPLVAGAILSALPRRVTMAPASLHLAAIAGPDAGVVIPIHAMTVIGSDTASAVVRDDAIDGEHATVWATPAGTLRVRDHGSVNGTGTWVRRGDTLVWRGQRRLAAVSVGDVIAVGRTLLEARRGTAPEGAAPLGTAPEGAALLGAAAEGRELSVSGHLQVTTVRATSGETPGWAATALARARKHARRTLFVDDRVRGHDAALLSAFPDPTRQGGWSGPIAIGGAHAAELARAVILARGRRPPLPMPLDEGWLSWLPPALATDGLVRIGPCPTAMDQVGWTFLAADEDHTTSRMGDVVAVGPVLRVGPDTADAVARSRAGSLPDGPPRTVHWADAAALRAMPEGGDGTCQVVVGSRVDEPTVPWAISLDHGLPCTVIAGAAGSGKSTLLATVTGALAMELAPHELELVILCARATGPLEPYLDLPHVRAAASHVRAPAAIRILESLGEDAPLTVVIVDDIDALGPDGRAVTATLEAIALRAGTGSVHIVMATSRPSAVLTPSLRAATATAIAMRTECESDSIEVTGVGVSFGIPVEARGMAIVRTGGRLHRVQVALPLADAMPRVRRYGEPLPAARSLATAARAIAAATPRPRPCPGDREQPAS